MNQNSIDCGVVRDLLPLYAENLTGEDSRALIEAHLPACPSCQAELASTQTPTRPAIRVEDSLRKVKRGLQKKRLLTALISTVAGLALLFGLFVYGQVYYPPIRYQEDMICVAPFNWRTGEIVESGGDWFVASKYRKAVDYSRISEHVNADGSLQIWVFVHYKKDALWDRLFLDNENPPESGWVTGLSIYPYEHHVAYDKIHATVYWVDDIKKFNTLQIVERGTDNLSKDVLDLCTFMWEGTIE